MKISVNYNMTMFMGIFFQLIFSIVGSDVTPLGPYKISDITVSGISSGAYMANQMHISFSSIINGSAMFAGGPFYCAESNLLYAETKCMDITGGLPQTTKLVDLTKSDAALGYVDPVKYLSDDMVYLYSGAFDSVINSKVVQELQSYYSSFMSPSRIVADYNVGSEHCMPTLNYGEACKTLSSPYIGNCGFDGAGAAFTAIYRGTTLKARTTAIANNLMSFSQKPYITSSLSSLGNTGYIYVPTACSDGATCHLHIAFHGCEQSISLIGNQYAQHSGYNEWAESNNIIVLYPYVEVSKTVPYNPNGCWDWWAYTGVDYGVKTGVQMTFVRSLIKAVSGK